MIGQTISHYEILEKLGEGGMGAVYKALDTTLDRHVAIKFLPARLKSDSRAKARFIHEAKAASALNHSNIAVIHEIDETSDGQMFIVMAYYEGRTLDEMIDEGPMSVNEAIDFIAQIASGLARAHGKNIVHRDIKPSNILVPDDGEVKLADFGLAKLTGHSKLTKSGTTVGTVAYMSPEQARGEEVDGRSDLFSLGVMFYQLLSGRLPFEGDHEAAVVYQIINAQPVPIDGLVVGLPDALAAVVAKLMEKECEDRYQSAYDLLKDLSKITGEAVRVRRPRPRWLGQLMKGAGAVGVVVLATLGVARLWPGGGTDPTAGERVLAVMYFDNLVDVADARRTGEMVTNLLIAAFSSSDGMRVVSSQRLYDALAFVGKGSDRRVDAATASQVAEHTGATWMLTGSVAEEEPALVLTAELVAVEDGGLIGSHRVVAAPGEKVFTVVDRLSGQIRRDLGLPTGPGVEFQVANVTTSSMDAYRAYIAGQESYRKLYWQEAKENFEKALEFDSTFAMAYVALSHRSIPIEHEEKKRLMEKAVENMARMTERERHLITARQAQLLGDVNTAMAELHWVVANYPDDKESWYSLAFMYRTREPRRAMSYFKKAIDIDPLYKDVYNMLAYDYLALADIDSALWAINEYIEIAPDEANPISTRGDLYLRRGNLERAAADFERSLEIKPDFPHSIELLGDVRLYQRRYDDARAWYERLLSHDNVQFRARGRLSLARILMFQGKLEEALSALRDAAIADEKDGHRGDAYLETLIDVAQVYAAQGDYERAVDEFEKFLDLFSEMNRNPMDFYELYVMLLARKGDFARAEKAIADMEAVTEESNLLHLGLLSLARAYIAMERGEFDKAVAEFEPVAEAGTAFFAEYPLALAYLEAGRTAQAVKQFEFVSTLYGPFRLDNAINAVRVYYYSGVAYEAAGWRNEAIEQFETFLEIWKDADPGIGAIEDARERLRRLTRSQG